MLPFIFILIALILGVSVLLSTNTEKVIFKHNAVRPKKLIQYKEKDKAYTLTVKIITDKDIYVFNYQVGINQSVDVVNLGPDKNHNMNHYYDTLYNSHESGKCNYCEKYKKYQLVETIVDKALSLNHLDSYLTRFNNVTIFDLMKNIDVIIPFKEIKAVEVLNYDKNIDVELQKYRIEE